MEFVSASGGGMLSGNAVVWSLGALPDGAHGQRIVRLRVSAGRTAGQTLVVRGELQEGAALLSRSQATVEVPKAGALEVSIAPSPWSISFTGSTSVTVRVANTATTPAAGVLLSVPVPDYVQTFYAPQGTCLLYTSPSPRD